MGHKETAKDTASVLGRMYDAIEYRGFAQETAEQLARWAGVPIYNGLTDEWHPTQILADFLTFREHISEAAERGRLLLPRRRPLQHGRLVSRRRGEARDGRPHRQPEVALAARRDRRARTVGRRRDGRADHDHRGRRRGRPRLRRAAHGRLGLDGRGDEVWAERSSPDALPGQRRGR